MEWTIIIHPAEEGGYWAEVAALPGCYSQGETVEETLLNVKEAIESHILALREDGQEVPEEEEVILSRIKVAGI
jgi:predicted RNase H-like HicB family nuclease